MIAALLFGPHVLNVIECEALPSPHANAGFDRVIDVTDVDPTPKIGDSLDPHSSTFIGRAATLTRAKATERINRECGEFRAKYITVIPGQETTYQYKRNECERWDTIIANGGDPTESLIAFPFIAGEATVRGITPTAMRNLIVTTKAAWEQMMLHSELKRQSVHEQLAACTNDIEIAALFPINWAVL